MKGRLQLLRAVLRAFEQKIRRIFGSEFNRLISLEGRRSIFLTYNFRAFTKGRILLKERNWILKRGQERRR